MSLPFQSAAILGAGLMGRLLAVTLAQAGCRVALYEAGSPDAEGAAARVAAAMLAPLAESAVAPVPLVRMGHYALSRWPELLAPLVEPVFFQREGTLVLWHRQDAAEAARLARVLARTGAEVPELAPMQTLDGTDIAALEPSLGQRFAQGLFLPAKGSSTTGRSWLPCSPHCKPVPKSPCTGSPRASRATFPQARRASPTG